MTSIMSTARALTVAALMATLCGLTAGCAEEAPTNELRASGYVEATEVTVGAGGGRPAGGGGRQGRRPRRRGRGDRAARHQGRRAADGPHPRRARRGRGPAPARRGRSPRRGRALRAGAGGRGRGGRHGAGRRHQVGRDWTWPASSRCSRPTPARRSSGTTRAPGWTGCASGSAARGNACASRGKPWPAWRRARAPRTWRRRARASAR